MGYCRTHYSRFKRNGFVETLSEKLPPIDVFYESFVDRVNPTKNGCHIWHGKINRKGYAIGTYRGRYVNFQRWAFQRFVGPLDSDEVVRHTCDTPACHNQAHWQRGYRADNARDMVERGRSMKGERQPMHKLTETDVHEVRRLLRTSGLTQTQIAGRFGVKRGAITSIKRGQNWGWLTSPDA